MAEAGMMSSEATETIKLRMEIDGCVLEAEGPREVVQGYFDAWRKLLPPRPGDAAAPPPPAASPAPEDPTRIILNADLQRGVVLLNVRPGGKHPEAAALLLILYGYQQLFPEAGEEILGTRLKRSWNASGLRKTRIDRFLANNVRDRLIKKSGERKASAYRLTPEGAQKAAILAQQLINRQAGINP